MTSALRRTTPTYNSPSDSIETSDDSTSSPQLTMSLPPAHKSVSETPAKMGVTEPHKSTQETDKDVENSVCTYVLWPYWPAGDPFTSLLSPLNS